MELMKKSEKQQSKTNVSNDDLNENTLCKGRRGRIKDKLKWLEMFASEKQNWHEGCQGVVVFSVKSFWYYLIFLTSTLKIFAILKFNLLEKNQYVFIFACVPSVTNQ